MKKVASIPTAVPSTATSTLPMPGESPSPTSSAWSSPTATSTGTPTSGPEVDQAIKTGLANIATGIEACAADNNDVYPPASAVTASGAVGSYVDPWPQNPVTGTAMAQSMAPGDFTYTQLSASTGFSLSAHLTNGRSYTLP
jgi:hypothetical protein